jgi:hypothetical protein
MGRSKKRRDGRKAEIPAEKGLDPTIQAESALSAHPPEHVTSNYVSEAVVNYREPPAIEGTSNTSSPSWNE